MTELFLAFMLGALLTAGGHFLYYGRHAVLRVDFDKAQERQGVRFDRLEAQVTELREDLVRVEALQGRGRGR